MGDTHSIEICKAGGGIVPSTGSMNKGALIVGGLRGGLFSGPTVHLLLFMH